MKTDYAPGREWGYSEPNDADFVLFDGDCAACRLLAGFVERRAAGRIACAPWQAFVLSEESGTLSREERQRPADRLRYLAGGRLLEGQAAWERLMTRHPDLNGLAWLASRLGLTTVSARALASGAEIWRRLCSRC